MKNCLRSLYMVNKYFFRLSLLILLILTFFLNTVPVQAQTGSTDSTFSSSAKIIQLKDLFRNQLEQYQISEREYSLYKQQYIQLQTLASLEKAVQTTREAMVRRSEVLTTYFDLLFAQLAIAPGIEQPEKANLSLEITELVTKLRTQTTQAASITDKQAVANFDDEFSLLKPIILQTSYKTRAYIQVGAYRDLLQRADGFNREIKAVQASDSASAYKQTARQRAYLETDNQNQLVNQALNLTLDQLVKSDNDYGEYWYRNLQEPLNGLQSGLEKLYAFIYELTNY